MGKMINDINKGNRRWREEEEGATLEKRVERKRKGNEEAAVVLWEAGKISTRSTFKSHKQ